MLLFTLLVETQTCSTTDIQYDSSSGVLERFSAAWDEFVVSVY